MIKINKFENDPNKPYKFDDYEQLEIGLQISVINFVQIKLFLTQENIKKYYSKKELNTRNIWI